MNHKIIYFIIEKRIRSDNISDYKNESQRPIFQKKYNESVHPIFQARLFNQNHRYISNLLNESHKAIISRSENELTGVQ